MGQFLDINEPPKLNEDEINNLYRHITPSEIERVIKNLITKKKTYPRARWIQCRIIPLIQRRIQILLKSIHKIETKRTSPNFYESTII